MTKTNSYRISAFLLLAVLGSPVGAEQLPSPDPPYAAALSEEALSEERGGEFHLTQVGEATTTATQNGNSANGNLTGSNWISDGAFSSSSGFATAIQNSGNNVVIQNSMILNITYAQ